MQIPFWPTIDFDNVIKDIFRKLNKQGHNCLVYSAPRGVIGDACIPRVVAGKMGKNLMKRNKTELELVMACQSTRKG